MKPAPSPDAWLPLGTLGKTRGLKGDLWWRPASESSESLRPGTEVRLVLRDHTKRALTVAQLTHQNAKAILHFASVDDCDAAAALVGATLELRRKDFAPLEEGEFYHCDVVGMRVTDTSGRELGEVLRVDPYPTVDVMVVKGADGEVELPMVEAVLRALDIRAREAVVDLSALAD